MPQLNCHSYLQQAEQLEQLIETKKTLTAKIIKNGLTEDRLMRYNTLEEKIETAEVAIRICERNILLFDCQSVG